MLKRDKLFPYEEQVNRLCLGPGEEVTEKNIKTESQTA